MDPTGLGVIGPGFLTQVPTLGSGFFQLQDVFGVLGRSRGFWPQTGFGKVPLRGATEALNKSTKVLENRLVPCVSS